MERGGDKLCGEDGSGCAWDSSNGCRVALRSAERAVMVRGG